MRGGKRHISLLWPLEKKRKLAGVGLKVQQSSAGTLLAEAAQARVTHSQCPAAERQVGSGKAYASKAENSDY